MLSRRDLLAGAASAALLGACRGGRSDVVRIGFMTNLTHAPVIAGIASGRIERALGVRVEALPFRAGPRVLEALLGDAVDAGSAGPSAIVYNNARHAAGTLRLLGGVCSGGASLVVRPAAGIRVPDGASSALLGPGQDLVNLRGKTLATVGLGTTQDISLRKYLQARGYAPAERGGDVTVHALDPATVLSQMQRGQLDGAWLPEPWATRVVREAGATRLLDERDLWPGRRFPTAELVARGAWARAQPQLATRLRTAVQAEVDLALAHPEDTLGLVNEELTQRLGKGLPADLLREAAGYVDFTSDPLVEALETIAGDAFALGLAPRSSARTLLT